MSESTQSNYSEFLTWVDNQVDLSKIQSIEQAFEIIRQRINQTETDKKSGKGARAALATNEVEVWVREKIRTNIRKTAERLEEERRQREESGEKITTKTQIEKDEDTPIW
ncbi:MAG: hypothetical protein E6L02_00040 [Thaumarchaeota archaeon]|nr:MAG: hypothetical protein E6L02_00040 [Nitrososphaerota archaeon]